MNKNPERSKSWELETRKSDRQRVTNSLGRSSIVWGGCPVCEVRERERERW